MKASPKYVALDVHQATTVASVREESGRVIARSIFDTQESAILDFFRGMRGSVQVTFEEGTQAQWLYDLLLPRVDRVLVCDRRGEKKHGNKGDAGDADRLSNDLRRGNLRGVYHGSAHRAALRELARTYLNVVEDSTRTMQRLKSLYRARGIKAAGIRVYQAQYRSEWLAKLPDRAVCFRAQMLYAQLDVLRELRPRAEIAARLVGVIAPAEELFWRGLVQAGFMRRLGRWPGAAVAAASYGGVHLVTGNFTLFGAAGVAGAHWAALYAAGVPLGALIVSHAAWDVWIFLLQPTTELAEAG